MENVFLSLAPIALLGVLLNQALPHADETRINLNRMVLFAFLPALVFRTVMTCPLDINFLMIPVTAVLTIISILVISLLVFHFLPIPNETKGAMILAASFGNVTSLGLPLLQKMFPWDLPDVTEVAVLFEVTKSSLNLSLGSMIAIFYGSQEKITFKKTFWEALKLPPIWALVIALLWRASNVSCPSFLIESASIMSLAVPGMMILSLGMVLRFRASQLMILLIPVAILKLVIAPYIAHYYGAFLGLTGLTNEAVVIEAAMPSQILSFVIAGRFKLDEETLAFVICFDTILSFATLPIIRILIT